MKYVVFNRETGMMLGSAASLAGANDMAARLNRRAGANVCSAAEYSYYKTYNAAKREINATSKAI